MSISLVCASGSSHSQSLLSLVRSLVLCKRFGLFLNRSSCPFRAVISHSSNVRLISFEHSHGHEIPSEPPHPTRNLPASRPATRMPLLGKSVHPEAGMWRSFALQAADLTRPGERHGRSCPLALLGREGPVLCWSPSSQLGARPETESQRKSDMNAAWNRQLATDTAHRQAVPRDRFNRYESKYTPDCGAMMSYAMYA